MKTTSTLRWTAPVLLALSLAGAQAAPPAASAPAKAPRKPAQVAQNAATHPARSCSSPRNTPADATGSGSWRDAVASKGSPQGQAGWTLKRNTPFKVGDAPSQRDWE